VATKGRTCVVCKNPFDSESGRSKYCSVECQNASRRERYRTDKEYRDEVKEMSLKYRNSSRGRMLRKAALARRRKARALPWYELRLHELPKELHGAMRLYWRSQARPARRVCSKPLLALYDAFRKEFRAWRQIKDLRTKDLREIRKISLDYARKELDLERGVS